MAHTVTFYNFSKRKNSTKQPSGGTNYTVTLKTPGCSEYTPIFTVSQAMTTMSAYNYFSFNGKYYYISNIETVSKTQCEVTGTFDALATYKSNIGNYNGFIARTSNSAQYSTLMQDNVLTPYGLNGAYSEKWSTGFDYSQNYVSLASYGQSGAEYNMIKDTPENITAALMGNVSDLWDAVYQKLTTPAEYIKSMKLFPFYPNSLDIGTLVKLGNASSVNFAVGRPLLASDRNYEKNFSIPLTTLKAELLYDNSDYRRYDDDFTIIGMMLPFVGYIALESWILNYLYINITYTIDFFTGQGQIVAYAALASIGSSQNANDLGGKEIYMGNVQMGINVPIVTYYDNKPNFQNVLKDVSINPLKTIDNAIAHGYNPAKNITQISSTDGMGVNDYKFIRLMCTQKDSKDRDYVNEKGYPSEQKGTPATGHYYEYYNPSVQINGRDSDATEINSIMSSGFYYE